MKVIITNATGSQHEEALLDKDSGVIEFKSGEISHVLFEKQFNKRIFVVNEKVEAKDEKIEASPEQSEPVQTKKPRRK